MTSKLLSNIAFVGLGAQGKAWLKNLSSLVDRPLLIGRIGGSCESYHRISKETDLITTDFSSPASEIDRQRLGRVRWFFLMVPDLKQKEAVSWINDSLKCTYSKNNFSYTIVYPHGFGLVSEHLQESFPQLIHLLLAPKAIAKFVEQHKVLGKKTAAVTNAEDLGPHFQDLKQQVLWKGEFDLICQHLSFYLVKGSAEDEVTSDLFSEQVLLCSTLPYMAKQAFDVLVEAGISPQVAYLEVWHEMSTISQTMVELGPEKFFSMISHVAFHGGQKRRELFVNEKTRESMGAVLQEIKDKTYFSSLKNDVEKEKDQFTKKRNAIMDDWSDKFLEVDQKMKKNLQ